MVQATLILRPKRDAAVRRKHPWVFSGAIRKVLGNPKDGDLVEVQSAQGDFLALGHYQRES